ncbi:helicase HerA-like domain-containing protein [Pseudoroseomonas sp. WGS1072]|uniref:helicase HerA-like domain-containing protein n=1 Tax=Roseomonas sp. WGS1072 TaxID=3366816 RepID=UPI003BF1584B
MDQAILLGASDTPQWLHLALANRHGLVAGATGTGKTITLQVMAEAFSRAGVPVFCADIKGDLSGISQPGRPNPKVEQRAAATGVADFAYEGAPVVFWDVFGRQGHPIRATVAEMGPLLLARLLELNDTQEGVLNIAFALADDDGLLLLDFKDLRAILGHVAERAAELSAEYGNVSKATIGTIQRRLLVLEQQGAEHFFGEPALALTDLMLLAPDGRGAVNVLAADELVQRPRLYATFLLWLLSELFEELPEVGDLEKPKLVFFFDEAHLLFKDAPRALLEKVEQVVRLIRSKGVGVYFVTQNPLDVPQGVLGQLGNRVQHALRAFTPADQKAVRAAAQTFRANPGFDTEAAITELGVGEALVSTLQPGGAPGPVQRTRIRPPQSRMGTITPEERQALIGHSPLGGKYDTPVDRASAYELLQQRAATVPEEAGPHASPWGGPAPVRGGRAWGNGQAGGAAEAGGEGQAGGWSPEAWGRGAGTPAPGPAPRPSGRRAPAQAAPPQGAGGGLLQDILFGSGGGRRDSPVGALAKSVARSVGSQVGGQIGRALVRGILGSISKR